MNDTELKEAWQKLAFEKEKIEIQSPNLTSNMDQEIKKFENRIRRRDYREIFTAAGMLVFFVVVAIIQDGFIRVGSVLIIAYLIWVIYYLLKAKMKQPTFSISKSIKEHLVEYKGYVLLQQKLVKNVLYWYILPLIPGLILFCLSSDSWVGAIITALFMMGVLTYVYWLNQKAAKENYGPLLSELNQAIQNLNE